MFKVIFWVISLFIFVINTPISAQTFPNKAIKLVIPFPPGGATDVVGRIIGKRISEELGQPVIIDNKPGAGGGVGTQFVSRSDPDGYTLVFTVAGPITAVPHINKDIGYKMTDLVPVGIVFRSPFLIVVSSSSPYKQLNDLIQQGKQDKSKVPAYGSSGVGALSHLYGEMMNVVAGTTFVHVPYKGTPGTLQALLAGDVHWGIVSINDSKGNLEAGKLRPLTVMSPNRTPLYPNVPSIAELGYKGIDLDGWFGLFGPAKLPEPTLQLLNRTLKKIINEPSFIARMTDLGGEIPTDANTPVVVAKTIEKQSQEVERILKSVVIRAE
jgi:tripartite-type tricarboxylate transporter receptor subunit TctC